MNPNHEEALFALALAKPAEKRAAAFKRFSGHRLQRFAFGRLGLRERRDTLIQRGQHATAADRQAEQVGVGHLLVTHQPHAGKGDGLGDRQVIRPESVVLGGGVGGENMDRLARLDGVAGKSGIRYDTNEACLRDGARRPTLRAMTGKPLQRQIMPFVAGPEQRNQQVGVEQVALHIPRLQCGARRPW